MVTWDLVKEIPQSMPQWGFHHFVQHTMATPKRKGFDLSAWAQATSTGSPVKSPSYRTLWRGWVRSWGLILVPFVFSARGVRRCPRALIPEQGKRLYMYPSVACPYCCTLLDPREQTFFPKGSSVRAWPTIRYEDTCSSAALLPRGYKDNVQICPNCPQGAMTMCGLPEI